MYESSDSQFFKATTEMQSGPDKIDASGFIMTFLIMLGVAEILRSLRLFLSLFISIDVAIFKCLQLDTGILCL